MPVSALLQSETARGSSAGLAYLLLAAPLTRLALRGGGGRVRGPGRALGLTAAAAAAVRRRWRRKRGRRREMDVHGAAVGAAVGVALP